MRRVIAAHLGEEARSLGVLRHDQQGVRESSSFEYDVAWLDAGDRFSLEPGLPLVGGPQFHRKSRDGSAFHAAIADTEPDGWGTRVIQRDHAKRRQHARRAGNVVEARPLNSMDYLLAVDDVSRVGALRLRDEDGRYQRTVDEGQALGMTAAELESFSDAFEHDERQAVQGAMS